MRTQRVRVGGIRPSHRRGARPVDDQDGALRRQLISTERTTPEPGLTAHNALTASRRLFGLDVARGLAVLGMLIAHTLPEGTGALDALNTVVDDERPRTLFAVVGGISLGLFAASELRNPNADYGTVRRSIAVRGVALIALGLFLQTMTSGISIVLDTWGLLFLLMVPLLRVPTVWLLAGAAVAFVVGTAVAISSAGWDAALGADTVFSQGLDWLVTGSYPLPVWFAFIALGYALARVDLTREDALVWMLGLGTVAAVAGHLVTLAAERETVIHQLAVSLSAVGFAVAVIAALIGLTRRVDALPVRLVRYALWPVMAVGAMPLTIYTAQILALSLRLFLEPTARASDLGTWLALTLGSLVFATAWRILFGQGPLERVLTALDGRRTSPAQSHPGG